MVLETVYARVFMISIVDSGLVCLSIAVVVTIWAKVLLLGNARDTRHMLHASKTVCRGFFLIQKL